MLDLKITLVQFSIAWEDAKANRAELDDLFKGLSSPTDLIILPEMFTTGFTMNTQEQAESMNGITIGWMERWASKLNAVITGSLIIKDNGKYYNRLIWMPPSGVVEYYDKIHLFSFADEDRHFTAGTERKIFTHEQWRICPQICYDLRFPESARNNIDYDVLLYVANWPKVRVDAWSSLLRARAIENVAYTVGVNRVGQDGIEKAYNGQSTLIDYRGNELIEPEDGPQIHQFTLQKPDLLAFRTKFPALKDQKGSSTA